MKCQLFNLINLNFKLFIHIIIICLSVYIAYYPALDAELVFDDEIAIIKNPDVKSNSSLLNLFKNDYWGIPLNSHLSHKSYRPLTVLTFRLNYLIHKFNPFGYHLVNVIGHMIASVLVYRLSLRILKSSINSLFTGLFFALHPLKTDAVISVVGRAEILSSIFYLIGLLLITDKNLTINCNNFKKLIFGLICGCIGFLCKEQCLMLLPLVVCFILIDNVQIFYKDKIFNLKKSSKLIPVNDNFSFLNQLKSLIFSNHNQIKILSKRIKIIWSIILCFIIILFFRLIAHGRSMIINFSSLDQINYEDNKLINNTNYNSDNIIHQNNLFLTSTYIIALNYWLLFYPNQLSCDWSFGSIKSILNLQDIRNLFTLTLIGLYLIPFLKLITLNYNQKQIKFRDLYIKLFLLIIIPFTPVLLLRTGFILAERVLYLPSIGFCLLIPFIYENYFNRNKTKLKSNLKILLLLSISLMFNAMKLKCQERSSDWKTEKSLFESTLKIHPNNVKMLTNMGKLYYKNGQLDEAISVYKKSLSIHNGYLFTYNLLGELYYEQNQTEKALIIFSKAREQVMFKLNSGKQIAKESMSILIRYSTLLQLHKLNYDGNIQKDIIYLYEHLNEAITFLRPEETYNLAIILKNNSKINQAIKLLKENKDNLHILSIELLNELLKSQNAIHHFKEAIKLNKNNKSPNKIRYHLMKSIFYDSKFVEAYYNLALLNYKQNSLHKTRSNLNQVLNLKPNHLKANLILCDLNLELDHNLIESIQCYTKLLNSINQIDNFSSLKNENFKVISLAHHNLCSVLKLINQNNNQIYNFTMNVSTNFSCTNLNIPQTNNLVQQQIHLNFHQLPIIST